MSNFKHRRYRDRYPRFGKVAILCEGDIAGFDVDLIEKWTSSHGYVDVWACGTKTAIYGVSDAIGRAVPTIAIEDRDYRTLDEATKDCDDKAKDRQRRAVNLLRWLSWQRHEIENYLIEPAVLSPVLSEVFQQKPETVLDRLSQVIEISRTDQVAQYVLAWFRSRLPDSSQPKFIPGLPRDSARPIWSDQNHRIVAPSSADVLDKLRAEVESSVNRFRKELDGLTVENVVEEFNTKIDEWDRVTIDSDVWRADWSGKEILTYTVRWLAGEFGWPSVDGSGFKKIAWESLKRKEADERDRQMAEALQPRLVNAFLEFLGIQESRNEIREEWDKLLELVASADGTEDDGSAG